MAMITIVGCDYDDDGEYDVNFRGYIWQGL